MENVVIEELIWTNPNEATTTFAAQTIKLDWKKYDYLIVNAAMWGSNIYTGILKCETGGKLVMQDIPPQNGYTPFLRSRAFSLSETGVVVANGEQQRTGSTSMTTSNGNMVPVSIDGIRKISLWGGVVQLLNFFRRWCA